MRKRIASLLFVFMTSFAAANECVLPPMDPQNMPSEGEELRKLSLALTEYKLCIARTVTANTPRQGFPSLDAMLQSNIDRLNAERKLWSERKNIPSVLQIREAAKAENANQVFLDFAVALSITEALYAENQLQIPQPYLDQLRGQGLDPVAEATRLSKTVIPAPKPWFTLQFVEISSVRQEIELQRATKSLQAAKAKLEDARKFHEKARKQAREIIVAHRKFVEDSANEISVRHTSVMEAIGKNLAPNDDDLLALKQLNNRLTRQTDALREAETELEETLRATKAAQEEAENELSAAVFQFVDVKSRYGSAIKSIETKDARLIPISADEQRALRFMVRINDAEIAGRKKAAFELNKDRIAAREKHEKAVAEASHMADWYAVRGVFSTIMQYQIEAASSAWNLMLATKGGPSGVLAEATSQLVGNAISLPTYYDASGIGRDIPKIPRAKGAEESDRSWWGEQGVEAAWTQAYKEAAALPFRTFNSYAKLNEAERQRMLSRFERDDFIKSKQVRNTLYNGRVDIPEGISSKIAKADEDAIKAAAEFGKAIGKEGLLKLAASIGRDVVMSVIKEASKEAIKKGIAELVEGGAMQDYMVAQLAVHQAYGEYLAKRNTYWSNEDAIKAAQNRRRAFLDRLEQGDLIVEKSGAFFPLSGYRLVLEIDPLSTINPRAFKATIKLGDVELVRDPTSTELAWMIPDGAEFDLGLPENITLHIEIQ